MEKFLSSDIHIQENTGNWTLYVSSAVRQSPWVRLGWSGSVPQSGLCSFLIYKEDMNMVHLTGLQGIKRDISGKQVFLYCQVCSKHSPILPPGRTRSRCSGHAAVLGFETLRVVLPPPFPPAVPSRAASVRLPEVRSCHSVARKSNFLNRVKSWAQRTLPDLSTLPFF